MCAGLRKKAKVDLAKSGDEFGVVESKGNDESEATQQQRRCVRYSVLVCFCVACNARIMRCTHHAIVVVLRSYDSHMMRCVHHAMHVLRTFLRC